jgi:hypothetical protein
MLRPNARYDRARVRLFRRRTRTEDIVHAHLERLGVSPFWLRSALDAIRCCEQGDYFEPVFSATGPAPARSVVALMGLEPFLRRPIDWTISPSESPFWVGFVGDFQDDIFDATAIRFLELYSSADNPSIRSDLEAALHVMVEAAFLGETGGAESATRRGALTLGSAGYVWRVAERAAQTTDLNPRADLTREVEAIVASFEDDLSDEQILATATHECIRRGLLFGSGSPGGWAAGGEFLRRGFRFADRRLWPDADVPRNARWDAFLFGVALYEVDDSLMRRPAWSGRHLEPSRQSTGAGRR